MATTRTPPGGDGSEAPECNADLRVGVAFDIGGIGDKSFNDAAKRGLDTAIEEGLVCEENTDFLEPDATGSNRDENVLALADAGHDLVIAVGFAFSAGINDERRRLSRTPSSRSSTGSRRAVRPAASRTTASRT